ncbi:MAG TPA: hypothetical protein ENK44_01550 [Caldithrix abyssi]|uniref:ATP-grasp domain-containing protein n=1 Tax=Caldithrix abyssi TaxID=187145 RepID=A0A7V4WU17_CALAY|nr:hypothetical protein [Caldithrix abyssi]
MKTVAIVKDINGYWPYYQKEFEKHGFRVDLYNIWLESERRRLFGSSFDGFVWRAKHDPKIRNLAKRLLYMYSEVLHIPTFPLWQDYWHYDDKIAQTMLLQKAGINTPETYIFYDKQEALDFIRNTEYPLVYKYPHGAGSANVGLLKNKWQARIYINRAFGKGIKTFFREEIQRHFVYLQKFLPDNKGDYKIICIGGKMFYGLFRENRPDKPLASGSGKLHTPELPQDLLNFVAEAHQKLQAHIMSYDIMKDEKGQWSVGEFGMIHGDLKTTAYDSAPLYCLKDGIWQTCEITRNRIERHIHYILSEAWKWI